MSGDGWKASDRNSANGQAGRGNAGAIPTDTAPNGTISSPLDAV